MNSVVLQTVVAVHTRSELVVGAAAWNCDAEHDCTAVQFPLTSTLNVCPRIHDVQIRSDDAVGESNCSIPALQLRTLLQAELELSLLNVSPLAHGVHTRSLVNVGAAVWPSPTPQFCTLMQVEFTLALKVEFSKQAWHTQFEIADAAAIGCVPAGHSVMFLQ